MGAYETAPNSDAELYPDYRYIIKFIKQPAIDKKASLASVIPASSLSSLDGIVSKQRLLTRSGSQSQKIMIMIMTPTISNAP